MSTVVITEGSINVLVQGSRAKPYKVDISIKALDDFFTAKGKGLFVSTP